MYEEDEDEGDEGDEVDEHVKSCVFQGRSFWKDFLEGQPCNLGRLFRFFSAVAHFPKVSVLGWGNPASF